MKLRKKLEVCTSGREIRLPESLWADNREFGEFGVRVKTTLAWNLGSDEFGVRVKTTLA
jgi:hypothetical protein